MASLLTTRDLQELINVDKSTIYRMAEDGRLPAIKVGRQWRFPADEIAQLFGSKPATNPRPVATRDQLDHVLPIEALEGFADLVAEVFGVMAVITDIDGRPLTPVANPCGFFEAVQEMPGAVEHCVAGWRKLGEEAGLEPRFMPSHLGFLCTRAFIRVGSELVGMVIVGGISPSLWPPQQGLLERNATALGISEDALLDRIDEVYHLDGAERQRILANLPRIADLISQLATARSQLVHKLDQIAALAGAAPSNQRSTT